VCTSNPAVDRWRTKKSRAAVDAGCNASPLAGVEVAAEDVLDAI
jgi:hypothetical protein